MNHNLGMIAIVIICVVLVLLAAIKRKAEWLLNLVMRSILGTLAIYFINGGLSIAGYSLGIGLNAITVLTSAILGIPGLLALYGIGIYQML